MDNYFDILLRQTLLLLVLLTFAVLIVNLAIFFPEECLLQVNFEFESLGHLVIELLDMLEDWTPPNVAQNLLLHLHVENWYRFLHSAQCFLIEQWGY